MKESSKIAQEATVRKILHRPDPKMWNIWNRERRENYKRQKHRILRCNSLLPTKQSQLHFVLDLQTPRKKDTEEMDRAHRKRNAGGYWTTVYSDYANG